MDERPITESMWLRCIVTIFYSVIFLLGLTGSFLMLYLIVRSRTMKTITNLFLANLAVSDIMMCILALPFTPLSAFMRSWDFGDAMCRIVFMWSEMFVFVSMLTFTAMALHRCFIAVYPSKPSLKLYYALIVIAVIWVISLCISLPLAIRSQVICITRYEEGENCHCVESLWPTRISRNIYVVACLVLQYVVPSIIIVLCYIYISLVHANDSHNINRDQAEVQSNRRTNNMLVVVAAIFICCWLPMVIYQLVTRFADPRMFASRYIGVIYFAVHITAMCSVMYKVFVYAGMDHKFRKEFKAVFRPLFCCGQRTAMTSSASVNTTTDVDKVEMQQGTRNN